MSEQRTGTVFKSTGSWYNVQLDKLGDSPEEFIECRVRGKMKLTKTKTTNPVAVGDKVVVQPDPNHEGTGIISEIKPRTNLVMRRSVHKTEHAHILACNIDHAMLMVTIKQPKTSFGFIDRFLVSTDAYRIPTTIIINKTDLYSDAEKIHLANLMATYQAIGVACYAVSVKLLEGLDKIEALLPGKVTLLAGHSGTGKSTYINTLHPEINQQVKEVSSFANKGVHTTTFAEMFALSNSGYLIDTPGIKELGLIDIGDDELSDYFPEMRELLGQCKFNNCNHTHEPKCAVRAAVYDGRIALSRYKSYLSMLENEDSRR